MTDDDLQLIATVVVHPLRDLLDRMIGVIERLTDRMEIVELEQLYQRQSRMTQAERDAE